MFFRCLIILINFLFLLNYRCGNQIEKPLKSTFVEIGIASWYGPGLQGKKTAMGNKFDMNSLTAAHRKLEFGTLIRVTNLDNQKQVIVDINDRGPVSKSKVLDLSKKAAGEIDILHSGTTIVKIEIVGYTKINNEALLKHFRNIQIIHFGEIIY
jgi:rare lipoprotein A